MLLFFQHNPDEFLSPADVATKFAADPTTVSIVLRRAVKAGVLSFGPIAGISGRAYALPAEAPATA